MESSLSRVSVSLFLHLLVALHHPLKPLVQPLCSVNFSHTVRYSVFSHTLTVVSLVSTLCTLQGQEDKKGREDLSPRTLFVPDREDRRRGGP
jgi:hypothetical protein